MLGSVVLVMPLVWLMGQERTGCQDPDSQLFSAASKYGKKDFEGALRILDEAESCTTDPKFLAPLQRQKGLALAALGRRLDALVAFRRAMVLDPEIRLDAKHHGLEMIRLFDCAKALGPKLDDVSFRLAAEESLSKPDWACPKEAQAPAPQQVAREEKKEVPPSPPVEAKSTSSGPGSMPALEHARGQPESPFPRWPMWTALAVGAAGAGVAVIFSAIAKSKDSNTTGHCDPATNTICDSTGFTNRSDARSAGNIATVGGVVAVLGLGAGVVLWLLAPSGEGGGASSAGLSLGTGGNPFVVGGSF